MEYATIKFVAKFYPNNIIYIYIYIYIVSRCIIEKMCHIYIFLLKKLPTLHKVV